MQPSKPAFTRPPRSKPSDSRKIRPSPTRGQTPSERSSTSSRSRRDTCYICNQPSPYDTLTIVACCICRRKYHRGCHNPFVPHACPPNWKCFLCNKKPSGAMQPPVKRRKLGRPVFGPGNDGSKQSSPNSKEIPESPQEEVSARNTAPSFAGQIKRPRPVPTFSQSDEPDEESPQSTILVRPPKSMQPVTVVNSHKDAPRRRLTSRVNEEKHPAKYPDSVFVPEQMPRTITKKVKSRKRSHKPPRSDISYEDLIGMALQDASNQSLHVEDIYSWISNNTSCQKLEGVNWKDGIALTLSVSKDFERMGDKWTLCGNAENKFKRQNSSKAVPSDLKLFSQTESSNHDFVEQGSGMFVKSASPLAGPSKTELTRPTIEPIELENEPGSALPSVIEETIDVIDLTMDDDDEPSASLGAQEFVATTRGKPFIDFVKEHSKGSHEKAFKYGPSSRPSDATELGEHVEPIAKFRPLRETGISFTDRLFESLTGEAIDRLRGTKEYRSASRHVENLIKGPIKAFRSTEKTQTPLRTSVEEVHDLNSPISQSSALVTTSEHHLLPSSLKSPAIRREPLTDHSEFVMQDDESLSLYQNLPANRQESVVVSHQPEIPRPPVDDEVLVDQVVQMELDDSVGLNAPPLEDRTSPMPAQTQIVQTGQIQPREESLVRDSIAQAVRPVIYTDSAAQTYQSTKPAFALDKITQISLEPRQPLPIITALAPETVDSTTQTENEIEKQIELSAEPPTKQPIEEHLTSSPLSSLPDNLFSTRQTSQADPTPTSNSPEKDPAEFENECLALLDEMLYPTNPDTPDWPTHFKALHPIDPFSDHEAKMAEIRARPTRKQIFGKVHLSRLAGNDALTRLNKIPLGSQDVHQYIGEEKNGVRKRERELNDRPGFYHSLEELLDMPERVVPFVHENQLAFRDYALPNASGRVSRPKQIFKVGPYAK